MSTPDDATVRRRLRLGTVGLGVAVAALSGAVLGNLDVLTGTSRRAVEATAAAYGTTAEVAFVTLHAPLLFGVLMGAVGPVYVGLLPSDEGAETVQEEVTAAVRFYAEAGVLATVVALGVPLAVVTGSGTGLPGTLALAFVAGLPLGVLALCGATVGATLTRERGWRWPTLTRERGWRWPTLLGSVAPVVGIVLAHTAPTGPVWTASAGATFTALALVGGGWSFLGRDET
ncbi:hypothetical protein [Salinigranum halophilum]|uniref:hypothetical protein n=1 Tax=Salinigranum halophilum TaxID=2565931 RepID=UPI0010A7AE8C|nr:hypothetical protein [Salinigranum halophilum]